MKHVAYIAFLILVCLIALGVATDTPSAFAQEKTYYLTAATFPADKVLTACVSGYHTASIFELIDLSNLHYAYAFPHALRTTDSGHGPPGEFQGWIRSGYNSSSATNCLAWTSSSSSDTGDQAYLVSVEGSIPAAYWYITLVACNSTAYVWCISNP